MKNNNDITDGGDKSIIEHLEELRAALFRCFAALGLCLPFAFYFSPAVLNFLIKHFAGDIQLHYFAPMEVFVIQLKLAFLLSLAAGFPYILKQLRDYIQPALYEHEKKFISVITAASSVLFAAGAAFCLIVILPLIMQFALSFSKGNISAVLGVSSVINLALNLAFVFGFMFQIPLITNLLIRWGIISYEAVSSKRRYIIVSLLIFSALLTPPDIISQIMLFVPSYGLFELGLIFSRKNVKKQICHDETKSAVVHDKFNSQKPSY